MSDAEHGAHPGAQRPAERELPGTRAWFAIYLVWMITWALLARWLLGQTAAGDGAALRAGLLALLCFYLALCNVFVPLPTAWIILLAASDQYALVQAGWPRVGVVACLAALATMVANLNEYHLLSYVLRFGLGRRIRQTRIFGWAVRWFDQVPFTALALVAFIPIPVDVIRWLAILRGYSRVRFALAYLVGRGPRYALFASCSVLLRLKPWQILLIQVGLIAAAIAGRVLWAVGRLALRSRMGAATTDTTTVEAAATGERVPP